ncbi:MAG: hypothetical protein SPLM_00200 [Spiroplasma phoeniceum]|uniref:hypothetical protein n=1 Tax=Spiroplasma phoeniceum TaxID=47835 RepID=UPI00327F275E
MEKRYLLVAKNSFGINTTYFYKIEEAKAYSKNLKYSKTTIIDLENENIKWKGCE